MSTPTITLRVNPVAERDTSSSFHRAWTADDRRRGLPKHLSSKGDTMTIRRDPAPFPEPNGDQHPLYGGRHDAKADPPDLAENIDSHSDERPTNGSRLMHLAGRVLTSPGAMLRALVFIGGLLTLVLVAAGFLGVRVDVGPVHIGPGLTVERGTQP